MGRDVMFLALIVAILVSVAKVDDGNSANEYIRVSVKVAKDSLTTGEEGKLLFTITPKAGFHVNVEPPLSVELSDPKRFPVLNKTFVPDSTVKLATTKEGYKIFKSGATVGFAFRVAKRVKPGKYSMEAALTYYYCSDSAGWCSFTTENFAVSITVVASP